MSVNPAEGTKSQALLPHVTISIFLYLLPGSAGGISVVDLLSSVVELVVVDVDVVVVVNASSSAECEIENPTHDQNLPFRTCTLSLSHYNLET